MNDITFITQYNRSSEELVITITIPKVLESVHPYFVEGEPREAVGEDKLRLLQTVQSMIANSIQKLTENPA